MSQAHHDRPKKPLSGYIRYQQQFLEKDHKEFPTAPYDDRRKRFSEAWLHLDEHTKQQLNNQFLQEVAQYRHQIELWNRRHPHGTHDRRSIEGH